MEIKNAAVSGVKWSAVSQVGRQILQFATIIIFARLLLPSDFGLVGMATIVTTFAMLFIDLGTAAAIIQRQELSADFLSGIFWVNLIFGLFTGCVLFVSAPLIARFYQEPRVLPMLQALSVLFLIYGMVVVQKALFERRLAFRTLARVEITASLGSMVVGVGAALAGAGAWSLVYQTYALSTITAVRLWMLSEWRPNFRFQWAEARSAFYYSLNLTGFNILNYFSRNADHLLVGRYLGPQALGYYSVAYRIMLYPLQSISQVIGRVMFPSFSQLRDDLPYFRRAYLKTVGAISFITFPLMFGLMGLSDLFVLIVLGDQWMPITTLLVILAPIGMIQSVIATVGTIYQAMGRTDWLLRWGLLSSSLAVLAIIIGLRGGVVGVASAYALVTVVLAYPNFAIPFKLIHLPVYDLLSVLWRPFAGSILMLTAIVGLRLAMVSHMGDLWTLLIAVPSGVLIYTLVSMLINKEQLLEILRVARVSM